MMFATISIPQTIGDKRLPALNFALRICAILSPCEGTIPLAPRRGRLRKAACGPRSTSFQGAIFIRSRLSFAALPANK
jgi:hypothetical protein